MFESIEKNRLARIDRAIKRSLMTGKYLPMQNPLHEPVEVFLNGLPLLSCEKISMLQGRQLTVLTLKDTGKKQRNKSVWLFKLILTKLFFKL